MTADSIVVSRLLRQQSAIAVFGTFALRETDLITVLTEAASVCAHGLGVRFAKVWRYRTAENDFIVEAGFGWKPGVVGVVATLAGADTSQRRAFSTAQPVISNLRYGDGISTLPPTDAENNIVSTINVVIGGNDHPYGVLEIGSDEHRDYDQHDVDFVTTFANMLGAVVSTATRTKTMDRLIEEMQLLVAEKSQLLEQKKILAEELQHRVRNNLQLVHGMLSRQIRNTKDDVCRRGLRSIARRVLTLAHVYNQLLGSDLARTLDFSDYLESLCTMLLEVQASPERAITLECSCEPVMLELDVVTLLGIIVTELVTNSFDHAFPTDEGVISVTLRHQAGAADAVVIISDNGSGFTKMGASDRHGLSLVHRLCEQISGRAILTLDHGATWTITFPARHD